MFVPNQMIQSQQKGLPSDLTRDSDRRKQGSWLLVARPVGESEVDTTRSLLDRGGNAALLVLFRGPLAQRNGHLEAVECGAVDLAPLAKVLVDVVKPTSVEVVDMVMATLCES